MSGPLAPRPAYALLTDGTQISIRPLCAEDTDAVRRMHEHMSPENLYLRFFGFTRGVAEQIAAKLCRDPAGGRLALGAWLSDDLVGVAACEPATEADVCEVSVTVADHMHHRGVGTLLLEHLASAARAGGVRAFSADVLTYNTAMLEVFADAGLDVRRRTSGSVIELEIPLDAGEHYLDAVAERERSADVASLTALLRPETLAVVGAGRRPSSIGHAILRNITSGGYAGSLYAVNPHARGSVAGVKSVASVADLPEAPDLAVLAVPAPAVATEAVECGRRGAKALVVVTSGLTAEASRALIDACHRYGMRLVGPNCLGVANTEPGTALDATFAAHHPAPGRAGVVVQSGGVGIALIDHLSRLGVGISTFASVGDKYDVSGNDMALWWEADPRTRLGIVYLESFGNPRKFSRTARRVARTTPLLTVMAGRSAAGRRAAASHTAAAATPAVTQEALFRQAGVIATDSLGDLISVAALVAHRLIPAGPNVAVVSNAGGAGVLAADACADAGLTVPELSPYTREALARLLPSGAATANPVDTTAAVAPHAFEHAVTALAADPGIDAVLALAVPTAAGELSTGVDWADRISTYGKPLAAVLLDQPETIEVRRGSNGAAVPAFAYPEDAVRALSHAWRHRQWLDRPQGRVPEATGVDADRAAAIIRTFLTGEEEGGWLPPAAAMEFLAAYGIPLAAWRWAESAAQAAHAAAELGQRVALKADVADVVHKGAVGALELDVPAGQAGEAYARLADRFGARMRGALVQPMAAPGVEVLCGTVQDPVFGPLIVFGAGGTATDTLDDRVARLAPLTDVDADELLKAVRITPMLLGPPEHQGPPPVDADALTDVLLRLSRLAEDHPDVAELDLNPIIARFEGAAAVDARVRIRPQPRWDPHLRSLRHQPE
ncbi:GNAT family N-acetyltransferase [Streptomonospora sp. PA3]|uniref:bifunctional acetate--CoA ligase family protein/GNAT family N-acetyltransferase n=1 Tax=Streptomonospora sp. PA3 TaxID=2607326 RepID=UPI0012DC45F5|nr:bifunctional GNAT family N-acetyltransferase/acetate--CoA ligase family protein [Streptomonospora sp. PA3]MUL41546.1 GNAT family N-acetyltransferase [Streptomonospora sp. PA3]